jgi:hypothetical protein
MPVVDHADLVYHAGATAPKGVVLQALTSTNVPGRGPPSGTHGAQSVGLGNPSSPPVWLLG